MPEGFTIARLLAPFLALMLPACKAAIEAKSDTGSAGLVETADPPPVTDEPTSQGNEETPVQDPAASPKAPPPPVLENLPAQIFYTGQTIEPIDIENKGEAVTECTVTPAAPDGLVVDAADGTCRISGTPLVAAPETLYTITGTSSAGATDTATIPVTVKSQVQLVGQLQTEFGSGGFVVRHDGAGGGTIDQGTAVVAHGGKIYVTGHSMGPPGNSFDVVLWSFMPDGSTDSGFAGDGVFEMHAVSGGSGWDMGADVTVDTQGRILTTGYSHNGTDYDMFVIRLEPDGTLDETFHADGIASSGFVGGDEGRQFLLTPDGKILVVGAAIDGVNEMAAWRLNSDGTFDTTFDGDGFFRFDSGGAGSTANGVALDEDGSIYVAGLLNGSDTDMAVWKLTAAGALDPSFGGDGLVTHHSAAGGNDDDSGWSVVLDAEGRILVGGQSRNGSNNHDLAVWRLNPDGTLDSSWGGSGVLVYAGPGNGTDKASDLKIDSQGRILAIGSSQGTTTSNDMVVLRFEPTGVLDTTFGTGGVFTHDNAAGGNTFDNGIAADFDDDGFLFVAGNSGNGTDTDCALWMLE